jgi:hypothetical protein
MARVPEQLHQAIERLKHPEKMYNMARLDLNSLFGTMLPFAQDMLARHGEYYPFGAAMTTAGESSVTLADNGEERADSHELIDLLVGAFRAQAAQNEVRAVGICLDVRTIAPGQTEKTDAICARLRHSDGESIDVFLPYKRDDAGAITYGQLFATRGEQDIFG